MDIYKHKKHGLVVYCGPAKVSAKFGNWAEAQTFKKMVATSLDEKTLAEGAKIEAKIEPQIYVIPTAKWGSAVTRVGFIDDSDKSEAVRTNGLVTPPKELIEAAKKQMETVVKDSPEYKKVAGKQPEK